MVDRAARMQNELQALCGIHESLGGLHPPGQPFETSLQLRLLPAPDLCLREGPVCFDVSLDEHFPGAPPTVRCSTPWEHLPGRVHDAGSVDQMGCVRSLRLLESC